MVSGSSSPRGGRPARSRSTLSGPTRSDRRSSRRAREPLGPAQQRLDPQHDLARGERLHHVVVRAGLQPDQPVLLLAAGGQDDHRRGVADRRRRRSSSSPDRPGSIRSRIDHVRARAAATAGAPRCRPRSTRPVAGPAAGRRAAPRPSWGRPRRPTRCPACCVRVSGSTTGRAGRGAPGRSRKASRNAPPPGAPRRPPSVARRGPLRPDVQVILPCLDEARPCRGCSSRMPRRV